MRANVKSVRRVKAPKVKTQIKAGVVSKAYKPVYIPSPSIVALYMGPII